jgi:3-oxoadipate enol-lactonase
MTESVRTGDVVTAFTRSGEGPPLLLMHGAEASHRMFDALVPLLAPHFTVIAYDQRDCGDTQGPATPATLADLADDAHALLRALGFPNAHVFGTSFGGRLAQAFALAHPRALRRLALAATWPLGQSLADVNPRAAEFRALRAQLPATAHEVATWFFPPAFVQDNPACVDLFARAQPATERAQRRTRTVASPTSGDVARIAAPVLLLAGEADRVVPSAATLGMAGLLPQARGVLLPGVGHVAAMQAPQLLASHLADFFLADSGKGSR